MKTRTKIILGLGAAIALVLIVRKTMQPTIAPALRTAKAKITAMPAVQMVQS